MSSKTSTLTKTCMMLRINKNIKDILLARFLVLELSRVTLNWTIWTRQNYMYVLVLSNAFVLTKLLYCITATFLFLDQPNADSPLYATTVLSQLLHTNVKQRDISKDTQYGGTQYLDSRTFIWTRQRLVKRQAQNISSLSQKKILQAMIFSHDY